MNDDELRAAAAHAEAELRKVLLHTLPPKAKRDGDRRKAKRLLLRAQVFAGITVAITTVQLLTALDERFSAAFVVFNLVLVSFNGYAPTFGSAHDAHVLADAAHLRQDGRNGEGRPMTTQDEAFNAISRKRLPTGG